MFDILLGSTYQVPFRGYHYTVPIVSLDCQEKDETYYLKPWNSKQPNNEIQTLLVHNEQDLKVTVIGFSGNENFNYHVRFTKIFDSNKSESFEAWISKEKLTDLLG
jgi:hypothetical protein